MTPAARRLAAVAVALGAAAPALAQPGAYELLDEVRRAYAALSAYHDEGSIERTVRGGGERQVVRLDFETAAQGRRFRWTLTAPGGEKRVIWSDGREAFYADTALGQVKPIRDLVPEVLDSIGEGGFEALVVPGLLAGSGGVLADPEGAAVEGPVACGEASCWKLTLSRMAGSLESDLLVDRQSRLVRRVEVRMTPPAPDLPSPPAAAPWPRRRTTIVVEHRVLAVDTPLAAALLAYTPAPGTSAPAPSSQEVAAPGFPDVGFRDEITVQELTVEVRALDPHGDPIPGLGPQDFLVRAKKEEVPVTAVDWVSSEEPLTAGISPQELAEAGLKPAPPGKLVVFFVQADTNSPRIKGHLRFLPYARELLASLHPDDQVAVVTFDSHLKLWQDFSRDRQATGEVLADAVRFGGAPLVRPKHRGVSLAEHLDGRAMRDAAWPEEALRLTAEALAALPGEKEVVYLGWGLGEYGSSGIKMGVDYGPALAALKEARASVFVLDISYADYHTLEIALQKVAADTGGTYAKTFRFPEQAVARLARTLAGYYLLTLDVSHLPPRGQELEFALRDRRGTVLARPTFVH